MTDIVVTWPKTRVLRSYLRELNLARARGELINFRIPNPPVVGTLADDDVRCYRVWDGYVRGYTPVIATRWRGEREVAHVASDESDGFWPAGYYIICRPEWYPCKNIAMRGFQGWRKFDRSLTEG